MPGRRLYILNRLIIILSVTAPLVIALLSYPLPVVLFACGLGTATAVTHIVAVRNAKDAGYIEAMDDVIEYVDSSS